MKKEKTKKIWRFWLVVSAVAILVTVWMIRRQNMGQDVVVHSMSELQERYDYNLSHRSPTNVHPLLRSVYFSKGEYAAACGTMVLDRAGKPFYIVTACHLFSETDPGADFYDYHILGPSGFTSQGHLSKVVLDSIRTSLSVEGIQDIAMCYIGDARLIQRTSKVIVSASNPLAHEFSVNAIVPFKVTSVTTGHQFEIVGEMINTVTNAFYLMLYESMSGESGSGFWKDEGELFPNGGGKLYVLSGDIAISPRTRSTLNIPPNINRLTPMAAIQIKW